MCGLKEVLDVLFHIGSRVVPVDRWGTKVLLRVEYHLSLKYIPNVPLTDATSKA